MLLMTGLQACKAQLLGHAQCPHCCHNAIIATIVGWQQCGWSQHGQQSIPFHERPEPNKEPYNLRDSIANMP